MTNPNTDKWLSKLEKDFTPWKYDPEMAKSYPDRTKLAALKDFVSSVMREYAVSQLERVRHGRDDDGLFFNNVDSLIKENQI